MARSFAHLVGLGRKPAARAAMASDETDDQKKDREDAAQAERDEEMSQKAAAGEDTGEDDDEKKEREARQAKRKGAAADAEDGDDDGDDDGDKEEMRGHGTIARARAHERGRIAAILSAPPAAANIALAVELACSTTMSRDEALRILAKAPPSARAGRADRNPSNLGGAPSADAPAQAQMIPAMWDRAFARFAPPRGERR